ncbi:phosphonoacetaldehyde hydrolase [Halobacillus salinarum]|uniref:Phosphonoacetaldehyde hydrolase n=1 Tax=Halobacillus salinarum TaxID=2932257 RepID=A0ABY4EGP1_9BACI|nr:phosphonoacetaldehyde hydrolase [Halobacillus salinarum]UOQ43306.1 phosphonoacetaldehyde hydrolase [Halobacillus salinarum]
MESKIVGVIFDWAGTTVDYGCLAPVQVFKEVFNKRGIVITDQEAREPMGLLKIDHIRAICQMERVASEWHSLYGENPTERDVLAIYEDFEPMLLRILDQYATPLPGVLETIDHLNKEGIAVGSTTGYTADMIDIVAHAAAEQGYCPDTIVSSTDVPAGRPFPWMCYVNAMRLNLFPMAHMVKVGDTVSDMKEGINAGMWTIGVIKGSSTLGLTKEEVAALTDVEWTTKKNLTEEVLLQSGANYVIEEISELPLCIKQINQRLKENETSYA